MDVSQAAVQRGSEDATEENHPTDSKQCSRTCNQEGYLLTKKRPPPHLFKLISLAGRAAPVVSKDKMHRYSWTCCLFAAQRRYASPQPAFNGRQSSRASAAGAPF